MNQISLHFINEINLNLTNFKRCVKELMFLKRRDKFHELLSLSKENILPRGAIIRVSKKHDFSRQTIKRIWENGLEPNKRSNSGRKVKWSDGVVRSRIEGIPWEDSDDIVEEGIVLSSV